jgi:hypothetical protein
LHLTGIENRSDVARVLSGSVRRAPRFAICLTHIRACELCTHARGIAYTPRRESERERGQESREGWMEGLTRKRYFPYFAEDFEDVARASCCEAIGDIYGFESLELDRYKETAGGTEWPDLMDLTSGTSEDD